MPVSAKWKQVGLFVIVLALGCMPVLYGTLAWWPHNRWVRILSGPVAVVAAAALAGAAASRFSKWWLLALIAPLFGIIILLTASV
jgi:hypothetical protein